MTKEEKSLLLKDLCARQPYGVKVVYLATTFTVQYVDSRFDEVKLEGMPHTVDISCIKPYYRPMSSISSLISAKEWSSLSGIDLIDWYNANHIDYRGLIKKGFAIEAPKNTYTNL